MKKPKVWNVIAWISFIGGCLEFVGSILRGVSAGMSGASSAGSSSSSGAAILILTSIVAWFYSDYLKKQTK